MTLLAHPLFGTQVAPFLRALHGVAPALTHGVSASAAGALAGALLSAVWEGAVLVAVVALALRLLPGLSAALRARVWLAVMAVLVALPLLSLTASHAPAHTVRPAAVQPLHVSAVWSLFLACAWAVLSLSRAVKLAAGALRLRRIARAAVPVAPDATCAALLAEGQRPIELCLSPEAGRPSVIGFFRPRVLLPPALFAALTPAELRQVLLHEVEHLRRHDDWTNLAQKLALVVLPLHPALFWAERRVCAERELACDDGVLRAGAASAERASAARKAYAACLVSLAEHRMLARGAALALGAWERQSELARRVHRLLRRPEPVLRPAVARLTMGGVLAGVLAGGAVLAGSPQLVTFAPSTDASLGTLANADLPAANLLPAPRTTGMRAVPAAFDGRAHMTLATAILPPRPSSLVLRRRQLTSTTRMHAAPARVLTTQRTAGARVAMTHEVDVRALVPANHAVPLRQAGSLRQTSPLRQASAPARPAEHLVLLTAWQDDPPMLTLAGDDEFSPSYAAVPVRGGWLLVQL